MYLNSGKNFCRALLKFSDNNIFKQALKEVDERLKNGTGSAALSNTINNY